MSLESVVAMLTSSNLSTNPAALGAWELDLDSFLRKCLSLTAALSEKRRVPHIASKWNCRRMKIVDRCREASTSYCSQSMACWYVNQVGQWWVVDQVRQSIQSTEKGSCVGIQLPAVEQGV